MGCCQYHMMIAFGHTFLEMFEALTGEKKEQEMLIESIRSLALCMERSLTAKPRGQA
jgi:hypothetical protein